MQEQTGKNSYKEWKRNLMIVLIYEKLKIVLDNKFPLANQVEVGARWKESDKIACCYMLTSVTSTLFKHLESCDSSKAILNKLEDMFRGQAALS
ncbi:hypothetical protein PVK06_002029 [Gossypium arboreum]|uniref:Uncharacterized protein n=1 Tax=Gossypium arboreum TaxID=29729 RepID=A0ABR0R2H2_GOSAR|nr:hypothetical protein PVK06_002029 [Gossypium arboreum]